MAYFTMKSKVERANMTHKPKINALSQQIFERLQKKPVEERLISYGRRLHEKKEEARASHQQEENQKLQRLSFRPEIERKSVEITQKSRGDEWIKHKFQHLFNDFRIIEGKKEILRRF